MTFEPEAQTEMQLLGLTAGGPKVVAIGGGHGLAQALIAIQAYASQIDAVVTVADDGGSSGRLAGPLGIPPPGDIRRCLLALSPEPSIWGELLGYRFDSGDIAGHSLGNLMLAALSDIAGGFVHALNLCGELLGANGRVHPVSEEPLELWADTDRGPVSGQVAIATAPGTIRRIEVRPGSAHVNPAVLDAIVDADQIVLAPGSLFTSLISNLVVPGVAEAINRSTAQIVFVLNLVTQNAETLGLDAAAHVAALRKVGGLEVTGSVLAHTGPIRVPLGLAQVTADESSIEGWDVVACDLCDQAAEWPQHDSIKLGFELAQLIGA